MPGRLDRHHAGSRRRQPRRSPGKPHHSAHIPTSNRRRYSRAQAAAAGPFVTEAKTVGWMTVTAMSAAEAAVEDKGEGMEEEEAEMATAAVMAAAAGARVAAVPCQ